MVVGGRDLETLELAAGDEIDDTGDRVRAVDGAGALLEDVDSVDGDGGKRIHVHEAAAGQSSRQISLPASVEQHQGARGPQRAQVHVGHRLGDTCRSAVEPTVGFAQHAAADAHGLEQLHHRGGSLLGQGFPVDDGNRVGRVDGRFADHGAGYIDLGVDDVALIGQQDVVVVFFV